MGVDTNCLSTYAKGVDLYMANVTCIQFFLFKRMTRCEEILASCQFSDFASCSYIH